MNFETYNLLDKKTGKNLFRNFVSKRTLINKVRKLADEDIDSWLYMEYYIDTNDLELKYRSSLT